MSFICIACRAEIDPDYKACPHCGEAITAFMRRYAGEPIDGKYQIISRLGVGGMGEVYKVLHIHLNSVRVIKLMRPSITDEEATARFLREARLATRINHPNVATLFDFATLPDGSNYMVWEYIEGTNLARLIRARGALAPSHATKLAIESLSGLEAIHRAGIIHRDISPENLMITRDDDGDQRVKVIDLGIAKGEDPTDDKTKTGVFIGKWKYCSPEHLGMLPGGQRIDARADLYSFGVVFFEMLTGDAPFVAHSPHEYLVKHASERPRSMSELNPALERFPQLEAIVRKALEKEREDRWDSARKFANALREILPTLEVEEDTDRTGEPAHGTLTGDQPTQESTVMMGSDSPTILTEGGAVRIHAGVSRPFDEETLMRASEATSLGERIPGWKWLLAALAVVVIGIGIVLAIALRDRPDSVEPVAEPPSAPAAAAQPGRIALNAFPWAEIVEITRIDTGERVEIERPATTPFAIDLPPGRYRIAMSHPDSPGTRTQEIEVKSGHTVPIMMQFRAGSGTDYPAFIESLP